MVPRSKCVFCTCSRSQGGSSQRRTSRLHRLGRVVALGGDLLQVRTEHPPRQRTAFILRDRLGERRDHPIGRLAWPAQGQLDGAGESCSRSTAPKPESIPSRQQERAARSDAFEPEPAGLVGGRRRSAARLEDPHTRDRMALAVDDPTGERAQGRNIRRRQRVRFASKRDPVGDRRAKSAGLNDHAIRRAGEKDRWRLERAA